MMTHPSRRLAGFAVAVALIAPIEAVASARCSDPQPPFVTDTRILQAPDTAEPAVRVPFRDPVFGSCVVRATNRLADMAPGDTSLGLKNEYSRVQSFNADESRILVRGTRGSAYLYDAESLQPLDSVPIDGFDPRWDATDPKRLYYSQETRLMSYDIETRQTQVVHEFANDFPGQTLRAVWSKYEGSPSIDGRYWGFMAEDEDWNTVAFLIYDQQTDQVIAKRDMRGVAGVESIDNAYISPLGNYFIADFSDSYCERGQLGTDAKPCGYMVYDRHLQNGRGLLRIAGHLDLALDVQGREVVVFGDIDTDTLSVLDLASGTITPLWPIDFSFTPIGLHISGRSFERPGWAVVSTHDGDTAAHTWMDDQVFLIELGGRQRRVRLAHTHSRVDESQEHDYWAEPQASVNRDLTQILFTSNWGRSGTEQVEMFLIALPVDWPELIDPPETTDYYRKVNAYFYGTFGRPALSGELAEWSAVLHENNGSVWKPQGTGLQPDLSDAMGWGSAPLDRETAERRVDAVFSNLFSTSGDIDPSITDYYIEALVKGSVRPRGFVNAVLNDLALMPRVDGTYGQPNGWVGGPGAGLLTSAQLARYRERVEHLTTPTAWWSPSTQDSLQIQFTDLPVDTTIAADIYDLDLFDSAPDTVAKLQEQGRRVLCYVNAGAWEDWRSDQADFPFAIEYTDAMTQEHFLDVACAEANRLGLSAALKNRELDAWRLGCPAGSD
jgi:hypothetical protein